VPLRLDGQTAGMIVMDARLGRHGPLAKFIAKRRIPGKDWLPYSEIARELTTLTHIEVTRPGVELWAKRLKIPETGRKASDEDRLMYLAAVDKYLRAPRGERTA
jgi:hypothetical protein